MTDVVFILGAGCSMSAGAPMMADFLDQAKNIHLRKKGGDKAQQFQLVMDLLGHLQRVDSKAVLDATNIETVFSALDLARTIRKLPGFQEAEIEDVFQALQWVIVRTIEQSVLFPTRGGVICAPTDYQSLARLIVDLGRRDPPLSSAVITFNYDVCMDVALDDVGLRFSYGLDEDQSSYPLLKLHGSLNWARHQSRNEILPWPVSSYRQKYRVQWIDKESSRPAYAPISRHMHKELLDVNPLPVLVPPTWSKGEHQREISRAWQRAAIELAGASHIFVIGYSLPETDQFFRLLFGLGAESATPLQTFMVCDPNPEVHERFRDILGPSALRRYVPTGARFEQATGIVRQHLDVPKHNE